MAEKSGPEKYAPPDRRPPEKLSTVDQATANAVEGEIREFVRRDVSFLQGQRSEVNAVRDMLRNEGERINREVAGYASLSHAATTAMKVFADSIKQWKDASDKSGPHSMS
jgi:hypothetical protein